MQEAGKVQGVEMAHQCLRPNCFHSSACLASLTRWEVKGRRDADTPRSLTGCTGKQVLSSCHLERSCTLPLASCTPAAVVSTDSHP